MGVSPEWNRGYHAGYIRGTLTVKEAFWQILSTDLGNSIADQFDKRVLILLNNMLEYRRLIDNIHGITNERH